MALDIGTHGSTSRPAEPTAAFDGFDAFFESSIATIATALGLACNDDELAGEVLASALTAAAQRWHRLEDHPNPVGWTLAHALTAADDALKEHAGTGEAGGYNRGLELRDAIEDLPLMQRAALVTTYHLEWSDAHAADGFDSAVGAIETRRSRALSFLAHHVGESVDDIVDGVSAYFVERAAQAAPALPDRNAVRRRGRALAARNRVIIALVVAAGIALGAAIVTVEDDEPTAAAPETVSGPTVSNEWLGPIADGSGGFVALNRAGASRFVRSDDGLVWSEAGTWNSRAIDIRTAVTGFIRSDQRYLASVELRPEFTQTLAPFIAWSTDLTEWQVEQVDVGEPAEIEGLQNRFVVLAMASSGDTVVATVQLQRQVDLRSLGIGRSEVCAESTADLTTIVSLCDGSTVRIEQPADTTDTMFFVSDAGSPFERIEVEPFVGVRQIVGYGGGFLSADPVGGSVATSVDGRTWVEVDPTEFGGANRFVLVEGSASADALIVRPAASGWSSSLVTGANAAPAALLGEATPLPIELDPAAVWTVPDTAVGPAGWALYVTTSRPWERIGDTPGWAVDTGEWIVNRLPDTEFVTAQSADGAVTHRLAVEGPQVELAGDDVRLSLPAVGQGADEPVQVTVTAQEIARSRAIDESAATAWVVFSESGDDWRVVWESVDANWFGSISVGDAELLIHGASLTGGPVSVPLGEDG